jgi:hypothetical protein
MKYLKFVVFLILLIFIVIIYLLPRNILVTIINTIFQTVTAIKKTHKRFFYGAILHDMV